MGAFGIFLSVLTFIYVIYYCVMIGMDLIGDKKQKKDSVELISVTDENSETDIPDEHPTVVSEENGIQNGEEKGTDEDNIDEGLSSPDNENQLTEDEIKAKNKETFEKISAQMEPCEAKYQEEHTASEMTEETMAQLMKENLAQNF